MICVDRLPLNNYRKLLDQSQHGHVVAIVWLQLDFFVAPCERLSRYIGTCVIFATIFGRKYKKPLILINGFEVTPKSL